MKMSHHMHVLSHLACHHEILYEPVENTLQLENLERELNIRRKFSKTIFTDIRISKEEGSCLNVEGVGKSLTFLSENHEHANAATRFARKTLMRR